MDLPGLPDGSRLRCSACGNVTRFDVETVERVRRYWHAELSGQGRVEEEDRPEVRVESMTCRWCGSAAIDVEAVPGGGDAVGSA